jgi:hypothetical protein
MNQNNTAAMRKTNEILKKWTAPVLGVLALVWILIRVIPKPQRASYPCMKVAFPFASALILYVAGLAAAATLFRKGLGRRMRSKPAMALAAVLFGLLGLMVVNVMQNDLAQASPKDVYDFEDPLGPNVPIGEAKGIFPGRVVWMHNPDATNEHCIPWIYGDGYFLDKNCDQQVVDEMLSSAILQISGEDTEPEAWASIFRYFNSTHGKGESGYASGEKVFIKINAVHAWNTNEDLSIKNDDDYGKVDTSPQVILAVLRQLINHAGVPQEAISIGDPYTNLFKHLYEKLHAEFPDVHYMSRGDHENREQYKQTNDAQIMFSDKGAVLDATSDQFYDCTVEADYVLSLPALKGHRGGGVTFFAKNHFGTNVQNSAAHMHPGLVKANTPLRGEYRSYRVFVDLMAYEHLGGKNLIYIGDLLWGTSMEHDPPLKFYSEPFNTDYTSSLLVSMDPVAIASVALDIYQEEFQVEDKDAVPQRRTYVRFTAVDDYLHQAASSEWWPDGIIYDPEGDGTPVGSLGVHEHWNNATDRKYSRNLDTGDGIELIYENAQEGTTGINNRDAEELLFRVRSIHRETGLVLDFHKIPENDAIISIVSLTGEIMKQEQKLRVLPGSLFTLGMDDLKPGYYVINVRSAAISQSQSFVLL